MWTQTDKTARTLFSLALVFSLSACGGSSDSAGTTASGSGSGSSGGGGGTGTSGGTPTGTCPTFTTATAGIGVSDVRELAAPLSPVMRSGFESGTVGEPNTAITHFSGVDECADVPNDWSNLNVSNQNRPAGGYFEIQYQGGTVNQRYAQIVQDPTDDDNQVLEFWLNEANVDTGFELRGRIQANFYENFDLDSYYQSVRVRLDRDFAVLMDHAGTFDWLTLFEAWNGANWAEGEEQAFHTAVNLVKPDASSGSSLHLRAHGRSIEPGAGFVEIWGETNSDIAVPVEQWFTLELYMLQGDEQSGRFYMTMAVEGEQKQVLFDVQNYTHHPLDAAPAGFDYINPMKLYMREPVLDIIKATGGSFKMQWDDLEFGHTAN